MTRAKQYLGLHGLMLLYSFAPVCSKMAGRYAFFSVPFLVFYGLVLVLLAAYALLWQQVIKRMPLTSAYANKAVTVVWGMVWGVMFFGEVLRPLQLLGAAVVIVGVVCYAFADGKAGRSDA